MVETQRHMRGRRRGAALLIELTVAAGLLGVVFVSFAAVQGAERRLLRANAWRAVAMEIVDGEMEVLAAGEWKTLGEGEHDYAVRSEAARRLPPGRFVLTVTSSTLRLEWEPSRQGSGGTVVREAAIP